VNVKKTFQILNIVGFLLVVIVNALANALPINNYTTGELSDMYPNLFVPAGITFSIWALIYMFLAAFTTFQAQGLFGGKTLKATRYIGLWFFISCLANAGWILAWHYKMVAFSVLIMLVLLTSLIVIYQNLGIGIRKVKAFEKWCIHAPFSIYLGWITIATVANITALLVDLDWNGFGLPPAFWTAAMIFIASFIGLIILYKKGDWLFNLVLLWAFAGIFIKRYYQDPQPYPVILSALGFGALLIIARIIRSLKEGKSAY